jgi:hypothetical protein
MKMLDTTRVKLLEKKIIANALQVELKFKMGLFYNLIHFVNQISHYFSAHASEWKKEVEPPSHPTTPKGIQTVFDMIQSEEILLEGKDDLQRSYNIIQRMAVYANMIKGMGNMVDPHFASRSLIPLFHIDFELFMEQGQFSNELKVRAIYYSEEPEKAKVPPSLPPGKIRLDVPKWQRRNPRDFLEDAIQEISEEIRELERS